MQPRPVQGTRSHAARGRGGKQGTEEVARAAAGTIYGMGNVIVHARLRRRRRGTGGGGVGFIGTLLFWGGRRGGFGSLGFGNGELGGRVVLDG
jgi:hypothetical protein